ncbi:SubName: Full=Related to AOS1 protein {ECO:0000313/EMBL:CCA67832.1} [Serendipita indica DSM 11827]|nr:SubName: Full=Related to AOS1 protein {ECO:0000313/EMBL:CCA67832.1} [Serendipita indica DSM 11827]
MRNATVLVVRLRGVATETIKNIVLAGIGKLIVIDDAIVQPEDLNAGFFFRDEDINAKKRVDAAKPHIQSLNPLVAVEVSHDLSILTNEDTLTELLREVDLVCLTDTDQATAIRVNEVSRKLGKNSTVAALLGYLAMCFAIWASISMLRPKEGATSRLEQFKTSYPPLSRALQHSWKDTTSNATKVLRPTTVFSILACWEYQTQHGKPPSSESAANDLESIANRLLRKGQVRQKVCTSVPREMIEAALEWSPSCAVVGGMLGQDILKALAAREPPMANFFFFDGQTCNGTVVRMSMDAAPQPAPPPLSSAGVAETTVLEID